MVERCFKKYPIERPKYIQVNFDGSKVRKKLKELVSTVFEIKIDEIDDSTSPDTVEKWDSLQQLNLAMAIENEFKITLSRLTI